MTTDRHIVELLEMLRGQNKDQSILIGTLISINPFKIRMYDLTVTQHIYANDETNYKAGDTVVIFRNGISFYILERVVKKA